jgi:uncharacterized protein (UPF0332 family)
VHGLSAKSHAGTVNIFGKEIVEKGLVSRELGSMFNRLRTLRHKSDYDPDADFELADVEKVIAEARYFLLVIQKSIFPDGPS